MVGSLGYTKRHSLTSVKKFTFADNNAQWKARRQAANESFYASQATASNMFSVSTNFTAGQVQLTTQIVSQRLQASLSERADAQEAMLGSLTSRLDKTV